MKKRIRIVTAMIASAGAAPEGVSSLRYSFCAESAIRPIITAFRQSSIHCRMIFPAMYFLLSGHRAVSLLSNM